MCAGMSVLSSQLSGMLFIAFNDMRPAHHNGVSQHHHFQELEQIG